MSIPTAPFHTAIIGAGITGLTLALGLQARNLPFTVYERHTPTNMSSYGGAGIGLSPNAERAMKCLSPAVHAAYEAVANPNGEDYFQWVDGLTKEGLFKLFVGEGGFRGCKRSDFVEGLMGCLAVGRVVFGKKVVGVEEDEEVDRHDCSRLVVRFEDGDSAFADTVIGCDGIHSRLRTHVFPNNSSSAPVYTHKSSFRALLPMPLALAALGPQMVSTRYMYNGPGAHIITYPVANNTVLNTLVVISDPQPWPDSKNHTVRNATREEAQRAFEGWHEDVRKIVALLPAEKMDKLAIFDMMRSQDKERRYHLGRVCLAGDAAHAAGPHLGAGAGFGIEDACLLAELLDAAVTSENGNMKRGLEAAFEVFSEVRYERTQWLMRESRKTVDLFEWEDPEVARDERRFGEEITWRFHEIWNYDIDKMVADGRALLAVANGSTWK